ncbi:MAG: ribonuclease D [Planctomycetota bacterium]|jgi:ribonuclease D
MPEHSLIERSEDITPLLPALRAAPWIALDTEFNRDRTYYPKLCLIQIAAPDVGIVLVDTIAVEELTPLLDALCACEGPKILHAARQDLEVFFLRTGMLPRPLFDTQVAAGLLGWPSQLGYAALVQELLEVTLDKGQQRADWVHRPLGEGLRNYAARDVEHLGELYEKLRDALDAKSRLSWQYQDTDAILDPALYDPEPEDAWRRVSGLHRLKPAQRAVARGLAAWREREAKAADRPRTWILKTKALKLIARRMPDTAEAVEALPDIPPRTARRHGNRIAEIVRAERERPRGKEPAGMASGGSLDETEQARFDALQKVVAGHAETLGLEPSLLVSVSNLKKIARGELADVPVFNGWRASVIGDQLRDIAGL